MIMRRPPSCTATRRDHLAEGARNAQVTAEQVKEQAELLFVYVYCLVDDAIKVGVLSIPRRPGPAPACTDAELLTIALVRHLLGRRSENGFLAEIRRDWPHLFPHLPDQPEVNRRTRWLWGAFEQFRAACAAAVPPDPVQQIDTSALPVKHPSRVRGPDQWTGPGNDLAARFGRDGAHAEWFYGFRLAVRTDLGRRLVRAWSIVPAAVDERQIGTDLVAGDAASIDALLLDKGFTGIRFAAEMASAGSTCSSRPPASSAPPCPGRCNA